MFLDTGTLQDLEIMPTPATRGMTLWSLVDRTRTQLGREALRQRFLAPSHTVEEILALQQAHKLLAASASTYRTTLDRADLDGVDAYLRLKWQLPADMPALRRFRKWYRQYEQDVADGQARVVALLKATDDLRNRLSKTDASILRDLSEQIAVLMEKSDVRELPALASRQSAGALRAFDQLARERAKPLLVQLLRCIGHVEAMWSVGVATRENEWSYPLPSRRLRVVGLFHPFLGSTAVPNDLHLDDRVRVCFVTGPNMAGKSTFLKAMAIAVLLAHMGSGVPATSMECPIVGTVFSSVQVVDNLSGGESFYLAEVRRIGILAGSLCEHQSAVAVIDEPFRGTNVHDAAEATLAVITRLAAHPSALVLVASHVGEVVPLIRDDPRIALLHFAADLTAEKPLFDYRLREGVSAQRLGMTLLRQEGVLDLLERSAKSFDVQPSHALEPTARG